MARRRRIPKRKGGRFKFLDGPNPTKKGGKGGGGHFWDERHKTTKQRAVGGDFWGDVGNFFTHTLPDIATTALPIIMSVL